MSNRLPEGYMSVRELSRITKVSERTLWRYKEKGMPHIVDGKRVYFHINDCVKWINLLQEARITRKTFEKKEDKVND